jgi:hypothetical protein
MKLLSIPFALFIAFQEHSYYPHHYLADAASTTTIATTNNTTASSDRSLFALSPSPLSSFCSDNPNRFLIPGTSGTGLRSCAWVASKHQYTRCAYPESLENCPFTCGTCPPCVDTKKRFIVKDSFKPKKKKKCVWAARKRTNRRCSFSGVADQCPSTCSRCVCNIPSSMDTPGMALSNGRTCLITADGFYVRCMGINYPDELGVLSPYKDHISIKYPMMVPTIAPTSCADVPVSITAGNYHRCVTLRNNSVKCWGSNHFGQFGDGSNTDSYGAIVNLDAGEIPLSVTAGGIHTCIILQNDNSVKCFGYNKKGQLGNGVEYNSNTPVKVNLDASDIPLSIAAGYFHNCILLQNNSVKCFGDNEYGQLGNGSNDNSNVPALVNLDVDDIVLSITAGNFHSCILLQNNAVKCFGSNEYGQLGNGSANNSNVPVMVNLEEGDIPIAITAGSSHTCILLQDNSVKCFGHGFDSNVPVKVNLEQGDIPHSIVAGGGHTCIRLQNKEVVKCFGRNRHGELGRGYGSPSSQIESTPEAVVGFGSFGSGCNSLYGFC